jgi:hypothetical protein
MNAATNHADEPTVAPETVRALVTAAVIATVLLTIAAFWLSYAHLHTVANGHGLDGARAWAWPATIDLFIVIGEILILVASVLRRSDGWAIFVTIVGSVGSVALNVAGVGPHAPGLNYVVAAVPPTGALLAFGLLMRQIKAVLTRRNDTEPTPMSSTEPASEAATERPAAVDRKTVGTPSPVATEAPSPVDETATEPTPSDAPPVGESPSEAPASDARPVVEKTTSRRRKPTRSGVRKKAPRRSLDEWVGLAGPIFHDQFRALRRQPTANEFAQAIEAAGHGAVSDTTAKMIRAEILDRADVPALTEGGL